MLPLEQPRLFGTPDVIDPTHLSKLGRLLVAPMGPLGKRFFHHLQRFEPAIFDKVVAVSDQRLSAEGKLDFHGVPVMPIAQLPSLRPEAACIASQPYFYEIGRDLRQSCLNIELLRPHQFPSFLKAESALMSAHDTFGSNLSADTFPFRNEEVVHTPYTLLSASEIQLLCHVSKNYQGFGRILDLGCARGGSTVALLSGLRENLDRLTGPILAFDLFQSRDQDFSGQRFGVDPIQEILSSLSHGIRTIPGDILSYQWIGEPIEVLFVDLMKSLASTQHVIASFFPSLIPNRSLLIHQDFKDAALFWIPVTMYRLREFFELIVDVGDGSTAVFRCSNKIDTYTAQSAGDLSTLTSSELDEAFQWAKSLTDCSIEAFRGAVNRSYLNGLEWLKV